MDPKNVNICAYLLRTHQLRIHSLILLDPVVETAKGACTDLLNSRLQKLNIKTLIVKVSMDII